MAPHSQPQNIRATKVATVLTRAARPSITGASSMPSIEVTTTETPATAAIIVTDWNWISAAAADIAITMVGPK